VSGKDSVDHPLNGHLSHEKIPALIGGSVSNQPTDYPSVAHTTTQNPAVRFLYVLISFLLQNAWRYLHWEYVASPRRGARRLWSWRFDEFLRMVRRAAETVLSVRDSVPANKPPDDRFER
jgi:hypothetical protein